MSRRTPTMMMRHHIGNFSLVLFIAVAGYWNSPSILARYSINANENRRAMAIKSIADNNNRKKEKRKKKRHRHRALYDDEPEWYRHPSGKPYRSADDHGGRYESHIMPLMKSPCRPESDGYFGGTAGNPVELQYGFMLEGKPLAEVEHIVEIVREKLMDEILSLSFPAICGYFDYSSKEEMGDANSKGVTPANGFKFSSIEGPTQDACSPQDDSLNFCGRFAGLILVFGKHKKAAAMDVHRVILDLLRTTDDNSIHPDLIQISSVKEYSRLNGSLISLGKEYRLSNMALAIVAIGIFLLSILLLWYIMYTRKRSNILKSDGTTTTTSRTNSWGKGGHDDNRRRVDDMLLWLRANVSSSRRRKRRVGNVEDSGDESASTSDDDKSLKAPSTPERTAILDISFDPGESSGLLVNGQPKEIEFHPVITRTRTYPSDNTSSSNIGTRQAHYASSENGSHDAGYTSLRSPSIKAGVEA